MIEIQCTSCHTRYRIDERVLPDETPTFKCSRCGHVFNADPVPARVRKPAPVRPPEKPKREAAPPPPPPPPVPEPEAEPEPEPEPIAEFKPEPPIEEPVVAAASPEPPPEVKPVEPPKPVAEPEENPLDRTFSRERPDDMESGENLSFDFANEPSPGEGHEEPDSGGEEDHSHSDDHWEVGDNPDEAPSAREPIRHELRVESEETPPLRPVFKAPPSRAAQSEPASQDFDRPEFADAPPRFDEPRHDSRAGIPEEVAYFAAQQAAHSSAWFLGLFAGIAIIFATASLIVHMEPAAIARVLSQAPAVGSHFQRPMVPATIVALHDVQANYERIKGGQTALLISGTAENVGGAPLHAVLLAVDLLDDAGKQIASNAAYCGNGLNIKMVGEMTPREIEFLQRLDPQKNFKVDPSQTAPFLLVFIDPPRKIANLRIQVAKAAPAASTSAPKS